MRENNQMKLKIGLAVVAVLLLPLIVWAAVTAFSPVQGAGDAYRTNQSGSNRVQKQEYFEKLYADIKATDAKIGVLAKAAKDDPTQFNKTNYTGAVTYCLGVVADYNAEARKVTSQDWRSVDLPYQINTTDTTTDCKE